MKDLILEELHDTAFGYEYKTQLTVYTEEPDIVLRLDILEDGIINDISEITLTQEQAIQLANYLDKVLNTEQ